MALSGNTISFPTSSSGDYCKSYNYAAFVLITSLISQGRKFICLDELYHKLSAKTDDQKNGVLWGVRDAKNKGLISKTETKAYYQVL
jgi:hypothetical protein